MFNWVIKRLKKRRLPSPQPNVQESKTLKKCSLHEFKKLFENDDTFIIREIKCGDLSCCIAYINGMVNNDLVTKSIILPLTKSTPPQSNITDISLWVSETVITSDQVDHFYELAKMTDSIISGDTILFVEGIDGSFGINSKGFATRSITEPETEKVLRGSHEGFNESIMTNLSMLRRRIKNSDLKFSLKKLGNRSNTTICICYMQSLVNDDILAELKNRLDQIDIDAILASNYIDELITDAPYSLFRTIGYTERPDNVAAQILEGRIAIFVDCNPSALTIPFVFIEYFQSGDDYYNHFYEGSIDRLLRIFAFLLTIVIPSFYIALITYHQEMVPSGLLLAINAARQQVPLPSLVEILLLLFAFDILRETGARLPSYMGQSLSIVGGLVIGQAAVTARLISAPAVILVAFTAITSLILPKLSTASTVLRIVFIILATVLGLYGIAFGIVALSIHLLGMRSFGVPYLQGSMSIKKQDIKDVAVRFPWWYMRTRPRKISVKDTIRQDNKE